MSGCAGAIRSIAHRVSSPCRISTNTRNKHRKTLRTYSNPIDLRQFAVEDWVTNGDDCWEVGASLEDTAHHRLITPVQARNLRPRDATELRADDLVQYESADRKRARRY